MLINEYLTKIKNGAPHGAPLKVLDMCCGKGGDLLKWEKGSITHLICTDIADVSVEQCQKRYTTMAERSHNARNKFQKMFSAEFFASDCTVSCISFDVAVASTFLLTSISFPEKPHSRTIQRRFDQIEFGELSVFVSLLF